MSLIGQAFDKFPMGSAWASATQAERDQYIRLMLTRLEPYGIVNDHAFTDTELGALATYVRRLFELEGVGDLSPPPFVTNSLEVSTRKTPPPFSQVDQTIPVTSIPPVPSAGTFILSASEGSLAWLAFPIPGDS